MRKIIEVREDILEIKNEESLTYDEAEALLQFFSNETNPTFDNITVLNNVNKSLTIFISEFVGNNETHDVIELTYDDYFAEIESKPKYWDASNLLYEPWKPVTLNIHYDLHVYYIFVIRESGIFDAEKFKAAMELNKEGSTTNNNCPEISDEPVLIYQLNKTYDKIRVPLFSLSIFFIMGGYIIYSRIKYNKIIKNAADPL